MKKVQKSLENKLIIYDSNCKVCSSLKEVVIRYSRIPSEKVMAYRELPPQLLEKVDPAQFRNGMALVDTSGEETVYGADGVAWIFSSQYRLVDWLLRFPPFYYLVTRLYKIQAYNRYIMATPRSRFACDCFPDRVVKYRLGYIFLSYSFSVLLTMLFGISLKGAAPGISTSGAAIQMLLMAGSGWILQMVISGLLMKHKTLDYWGHLGSIMVAGLFVLVPWMVFYSVTGIFAVWMPRVSVMVSSGYMLYLHHGRMRHLELPGVWTLSWFTFLQAGALGWITYFYF